MAQQFYAGWGITSERDGREPLPIMTLSNPSPYSCRDGCFGAMSRAVWNYVINNLRRQGISLDPWENDTRDIYSWYIYNARDTFRVESTTYMVALSDIHISYSIPRIISKLEHKFPTVTFTQDFVTVGLDKTADGIRLVGDLQVLPAWYWATFLMRLVYLDNNPEAKPDRPWKDVNRLIARSMYNEMYPQMWDDLRSGVGQDIASGWKMLACGAGPMVTGYSDINSLIGRIVGFIERNLVRAERGETLPDTLTREIF